MVEGNQGPNPNPENNLNNGNPRSPFGASLAKYSGPTLEDKWDKIHKVDLPFLNINQPLLKRKKIRMAVKGFHIVYIWTHMPTGACLVGSTKLDSWVLGPVGGTIWSLFRIYKFFKSNTFIFPIFKIFWL